MVLLDRRRRRSRLHNRHGAQRRPRLGLVLRPAAAKPQQLPMVAGPHLLHGRRVPDVWQRLLRRPQAVWQQRIHIHPTRNRGRGRRLWARVLGRGRKQCDQHQVLEGGRVQCHGRCRL